MIEFNEPTAMTPLQKTQVAYAHFTLEEWQLLVRCVSHTRAYFYLNGTDRALDENKVNELLSKFPSAVL